MHSWLVLVNMQFFKMKLRWSPILDKWCFKSLRASSFASLRPNETNESNMGMVSVAGLFVSGVSSKWRLHEPVVVFNATHYGNTDWQGTACCPFTCPLLSRLKHYFVFADKRFQTAGEYKTYYVFGFP